jgi:GST-like protein
VTQPAPLPGYELIGSPGSGSAIAEMAFAAAGFAVATTDLPYLEPGPGRDRLRALNPLAQVPTLVLPDGSAMTESAAIVLHVGDLAPESGLVPAPGLPERARFLNLLVLMVAAIYPTFTYGDEPADWTEPGEPADRLRSHTDRRRQMLWEHLEGGVDASPFILGGRLSALDLYVVAMLRWRPGLAWFEAETPKLVGVRNAALQHPAVAAVAARHWPD